MKTILTFIAFIIGGILAFNGIVLTIMHGGNWLANHSPFVMWSLLGATLGLHVYCWGYLANKN